MQTVCNNADNCSRRVMCDVLLSRPNYPAEEEEERGATLEENASFCHWRPGVLWHLGIHRFVIVLDASAGYWRKNIPQLRPPREDQDNESSFVATKVAICMEKSPMFHSNYWVCLLWKRPLVQQRVIRVTISQPLKVVLSGTFSPGHPRALCWNCWLPLNMAATIWLEIIDTDLMLSVVARYGGGVQLFWLSRFSSFFFFSSLCSQRMAHSKVHNWMKRDVFWLRSFWLRTKGPKGKSMVLCPSNNSRSSRPPDPEVEIFFFFF